MMMWLIMLLCVGAVRAQSTETPALETSIPEPVDDNLLKEDYLGPIDEKDAGVPMSSGVWKKFGGRSFMFVRSPMPWSRAQTHCIALGGSLASIHTTGENNFVSSMTGGRAWIGLSDAANEGYWLWLTGAPLTYSKWCAGEPNNDRGQHCGVINHGGRRCWDDMWCHHNVPFVCAKK